MRVQTYLLGGIFCRLCGGSSKLSPSMESIESDRVSGSGLTPCPPVAAEAVAVGLGRVAVDIRGAPLEVAPTGLLAPPHSIIRFLTTAFLKSVSTLKQQRTDLVRTR